MSEMVITVISFVVHRIKLFINLITVPDTKYLINNTVNVSASLIAQLVKNLPTMQETPVQFLGWKICWRRGRLPTPVFLGFPCGSAGKESACNKGDLGSIPGLGRSPGGGHGNPTPVFLPGESHRQRSLAGYSPWGHKSLIRPSD